MLWARLVNEMSRTWREGSKSFKRKPTKKEKRELLQLLNRPTTERYALTNLPAFKSNYKKLKVEE